MYCNTVIVMSVKFARNDKPIERENSKLNLDYIQLSSSFN